MRVARIVVFVGCGGFAAGLALGAAGCISSDTRRTIASAEQAAASVRRVASADAAPTRAPPNEAALARSVDLASLQIAALARHPSAGFQTHGASNPAIFSGSWGHPRCS